MNGIGPTGEVDYALIALEHEGMYGQVEGSVLMPLSYPFSTGLRVVCEEGTVETSFRFYSVERPETVLTRYPMRGLAQVPEMPDEEPILGRVSVLCRQCGGEGGSWADQC